MKKLLIVLLALTVIGVFAFAQDEAAPAAALAWSGSVQTGFKLIADSDNNVTGQLWESNNPSPGSIWLDGTFAGTNAGGKFEIYTKAYDSISSDALFGWWKPISMITLSAGEGYGAAYTTPYEGNGSGGTGFQIKVAPIDGLVFAIDYPFGKVTATDLDFSTVQIQASYAAKDLLTVGVNADLGTKVYNVGVNVVAVPNLTAQVEFKYLMDPDPASYRAEEYFAYAMGALKPAIWIYESSVKGATAAADDPAFGVKPSITYAMASVTPGAYFQYNAAVGDADAAYSLGVNAAMTVEKNAIYLYADYQSAKTWDLGLRYIVSF